MSLEGILVDLQSSNFRLRSRSCNSQLPMVSDGEHALKFFELSLFDLPGYFLFCIEQDRDISSYYWVDETATKPLCAPW